MSMTPNLELTHVLPNQNNKETTINALADGLDVALCDFLTIDLTSGNATLTKAQLAADILFVCSGHTVARNVNLPQMKRLFFVRNAGTATVSLIRGSTTLTLDASRVGIYYLDGTTNGLFRLNDYGATTGTRSYILSGYRNGTPADNETILFVPIAEAMTLPANLTGSFGRLETAATVAQSFTLRRNANNIGSIDFAANATTATFTFSNAVTFTAGDTFTILAPTSVNSNLSGFSFAIKGTY